MLVCANHGYGVAVVGFLSGSSKQGRMLLITRNDISKAAKSADRLCPLANSFEHADRINGNLVVSSKEKVDSPDSFSQKYPWP